MWTPNANSRDPSLTCCPGKPKAEKRRETVNTMKPSVHPLPSMSLLQFVTNRQVGSSSPRSLLSSPSSSSSIIMAHVPATCTSPLFRPVGTLTHSAHITLSDLQPTRHLRYSGVLQLDSLSTLLVARNLTMTSASRLTSKSRRLLTPVRDELFHLRITTADRKM
jgi:hypothetical protein